MVVEGMSFWPQAKIAAFLQFKRLPQALAVEHVRGIN